MQEWVSRVQLSEVAADYLLALVTKTRRHPEILLGCSPRGALVFANLVRARAFLDGRDYVIPDDMKALACDVLVHRIAMGHRSDGGSRAHAISLIEEIVAEVPVPR
ncbi:MAG: MoxR family ATPase [Myxococcota bacterium]